jgi:arginyl-tRNA synthetase
MSRFPELAQALELVLRATRAGPSGAADPDALLSKLVAYLVAEDSRRERAYASLEERVQSLCAAQQEFLSRADERQELGRSLVEERVSTMRLQRENAQLREENAELCSGLTPDGLRELAGDVEALSQALEEAANKISSLLNSRLINVARFVNPGPSNVVRGAVDLIAVSRERLSKIEQKIDKMISVIK